MAGVRRVSLIADVNSFCFFFLRLVHTSPKYCEDGDIPSPITVFKETHSSLPHKNIIHSSKSHSCNFV